MKRGLFRSSLGVLLNADTNGAINMIRKSKGKVFEPWVQALASSGCVYQPQKLRFAGSGSLSLSNAVGDSTG